MSRLLVCVLSLGVLACDPTVRLHVVPFGDSVFSHKESLPSLSAETILRGHVFTNQSFGGTTLAQAQEYWVPRIQNLAAAGFLDGACTPISLGTNDAKDARLEDILAIDEALKGRALWLLPRAPAGATARDLILSAIPEGRVLDVPYSTADGLHPDASNTGASLLARTLLDTCEDQASLEG